MFEKIVLRRSDKGPALSAGELAEALLYYQNIHIVFDYGSFIGLVSQIGMPTLLSLLSRPNVTATYCEESLATQTTTTPTGPIYQFIAYSIVGDQESGTITNRKKKIEFALSKKGYEKKQARRFAERFRVKVPFRKLSDDHFVKGGIIEAAKLDLYDEAFVSESIRLSIIERVGKELLPSSMTFNVYPDANQFRIDTNIDFAPINEVLKRIEPNHGDLTPAHLVGNILNARADTILASYLGGEFYTSDLTSNIIRLKHNELLRRIGIEKSELQEFSSIVIDDSPSLRETINSGEKSFDEFLTLLDKSEKFKEWIQGVNPDEKLVKEYWEQVSSEGWIDRLPVKSIRYLIGATIGVIEPITGHAVSIADSFLLEKLAGGWRPSHFVERKLKPFLSDGQ